MEQVRRSDTAPRRALANARINAAALLALALLPALAWPEGAVKRNQAQRAAFERVNPCPATGRTHGACPGYVVDHIRPLCAGGLDRPANMQWQTRGEAKAKNRIELAECRKLRAVGR